MKFKKKAITGSLLISLMLLMTISSALAVVEAEETGEDYNGAPDIDFYKTNNMGFFERLLYTEGVSLTIIDGAMCKENPSWSNDKDKNVIKNRNGDLADRVCWTNKDGGSPSGIGDEHQGVAYQIWDMGKDGTEWTPLHPVRVDGGNGFIIRAGERKCVDITAGNEYYRLAYYCDDFSKSCTKFQQVCTSDGKTLSERFCDTTGRETIYSDWVDGSVDSCDNIVSKPANKEKEVDQPQQKPEAPKCNNCDELGGSFTNIVSPSNVQPNEKFEIKATFTAETKGIYYIESGMVEQGLPLAITLEGSACDGDPRWSGDFISFNEGESIDFSFVIQSREESGKYETVVGAYTGCLSAGGEAITKDSITVNVLSETQESRAGWLGTTDEGKPLRSEPQFWILIVFTLAGIVLSPMFPQVGIPIAIGGATLLLTLVF